MLGSGPGYFVLCLEVGQVPFFFLACLHIHMYNIWWARSEWARSLFFLLSLWARSSFFVVASYEWARYDVGQQTEKNV